MWRGEMGVKVNVYEILEIDVAWRNGGKSQCVKLYHQ